MPFAIESATIGSKCMSSRPNKVSHEKPVSEPSQSARSRRTGITVAMVLMVISVAITATFMIIGGTLTVKNLLAIDWKPAHGLLIEARADHFGGKKDNPLVPIVRYQYMVGGKTYTSTQWSPAGVGPDMQGQIDRLKAESPLVVHYNPRNPADAAVVMPSLHMGFLPFTLGLGLFFIFVVAVSGGALFSALHPEVAGIPESPIKDAITLSLRIGFVLCVSSATGFYTLLSGKPGGWWQWLVSILLVVYVVRKSKRQKRTSIGAAG